MDNPSYVGEETTTNCAEERSQHNVDEAKQDKKTFSCPDCGCADQNPAARFCWYCGCKLKMNKVPEEKAQQENKASTLEEKNAHGSSEENIVHTKGKNEEHQTSSDRDFTIANDSSRQETPMKDDNCSLSSQSPGLPVKRSSNGVAENVAIDKVIESANKVESNPISIQSAREVISSNETTSNVADSSANEVKKTDDSSPTSRQDFGEKPSLTEGTMTVDDDTAKQISKEKDSSPVSTQDVGDKPSSTESAKNVADDNARQNPKEDDPSPTSRQDVREQSSLTGITKMDSDGSAKENDSSLVSTQDVGQALSLTESTRNVADDNAIQVSKEVDSSPTSGQDFHEKPSSTESTKNATDYSTQQVPKEDRSNSSPRQNVCENPSLYSDANNVADGSSTQISETVGSRPASEQDKYEKQSSSGRSSESSREELLLQAENVPRSKDDSVNGATNSAIVNINGKIPTAVQRDEAPDPTVDDDKATKDKNSGDKAKKKRLLDIAQDHPLMDGTSTTVAKDKPVPTDAEAAENKSVENETLNNADVDNESSASENDSDSCDGSSVPDKDKKAKNEKGSKREEQKGKGKGKWKVNSLFSWRSKSRDKAPDRTVDDDKATKDKNSGDKAKKKRLLDIAQDHPLMDGTSTTVAKDKPVPTDAEAAENKSVENETLKNADVDNESNASEDDSDSCDDSSVPDKDKKAKNEKGSKREEQKGKGRGKWKKDREKKKERKQRREDKRKEKETDDQKESETNVSSNENAGREGKRGITTRSSSKAGRGNVASEPTASGATAKSQDKEPKETTAQESERQINYLKKQSSTFTKSTGDTNELQIHFYALLDPAFGSSDHMCISLGPPIADWEDGPFIKLKCLGKCEEYEILNGTLYLPTSFKTTCLKVPYKYVKVLNGVHFEFISRPKIDNVRQSVLNRLLIIHSGDWKGWFKKFDSIVSPSTEALKFLKTFYPCATRSIAEKSDIEEFTVCWRAFLPKYTFCSWCMEDVIDCCITVMERLCDMNFTASGYHCCWRFPEFGNSGKKEIFTSIFRQNIEENHKLLEKADQNELPNVLLSSITFACILVSLCGQEIPWKECLKLIETFSLVRLRSSGTTLEAIVELLSKHVRNFLRIGKELKILVKETLEQYSFRKETTAWWGMLALISILYDMAGEKLEFEYIKALLPRISLSEKEVDIVEVETALYYAPKLEQIILLKFGLRNYELILKIEGLDPVVLLHRVKLTINGRHLTSSEVKALEELLLLLKSKIEGYEASTIERIQTGIGTVLGMLSALLTVMNPEELISIFWQLLGILEIFIKKAEKSVIEKMGTVEGIFQAFEKGIEDIAESCRRYFKEKHYFFSFKSACELLDLFFKTDLCFDRLKMIMDEKVEGVVNYITRLKMENRPMTEEIIEVIRSADTSHNSPKMLELFDQTMNVIIDESKFQDHAVLLNYLSNYDSSKLWRLLCKVLPQRGSKQTVLKKLLDWPATTSFIKSCEKVTKVSGDAGESRFLEAMEYFKEYGTKLIKGEIAIEELKIITSNTNKFCQILSAIKPLSASQASSTEEMLMEAISKRTEEENFINAQRAMVYKLHTNLVEYSGDKICDLKRLDDALQQKWIHLPLSQLCSRENGHLKDLFFNLPEDVQFRLGRMCLAFRSTIFRQMWKRLASGIEDIKIEDVIDCIFQPVLSNVCTTVQSLLDQTITLKRINKIFEEFKTDDGPNNIEKEVDVLILIAVTEDNSIVQEQSKDVKKVVNKIFDFFKLQRNRKKASSVIKLGEHLKLRRDFKLFEEVENKTAFNINQANLKSLRKDHFKAAKALEDVTDEMEECIDCILRCMNVIMWLREELKDLREVKTFVDLLSISAGESDFEVDRVSCLHTVCLQFEPIIFKIDEDSGLEQLIKCCKEVIDKTSKDPQLLEKLLDCNRLLEWFKNERESYGSVATSSMMEAEAVNRRGYYKIGSLESFDVQQSVVTLENSLHLYVPEKKNGTINGQEDSISSKENVKIYKLNDIGDLQSRLMLIGGQQGKEREMGQIEKDCFLQMFEAVTRVAVLFIELCDSGCIKYLTWNSKFTCNLDHGVDAFRETIKSVEKECIKLEADLKEWRFELDMKRTEFPFLNYYTVRQLLMLQTNLKYVILKENLKALRDLPAQVFSLLDEVYPGIDLETFRNILLKSSHRRWYGDKSSQDSSWKRVARNDDKFIEVSADAIEKFIAELEEEGHDEDVAKAATMHCGLKDRSVASVWAMEHCDNEEEITELAKQLNSVLERKEDEGLQHSSQIDGAEHDAATTSANFMEKDMIEHLTLKDLGKVLDELAKNRRKRQRKLKPFETMNNKKPNLMAVPRDDLLLVVIDIYKQGGGCLPASGEVEICNHGTSIEKIELLFRRALNDPNGIYTLAFIDELDYNVAVKAYEKLQSLQQERANRVQDAENDTFNLLLMCSSEREDGSFLASAWDEFRIVPHRCPSTEEASKFLKEQLMCDPNFNQSDYVHAGYADEERSTVRVIKSHTAGTGKSLFITRVGETLQLLIQKSNFARKQVNSSVDTEVIVTTSMQGTVVDQDVVVRELIPYDKKKKEDFPRIYHFDVASTVTSNLDSFMFQLLIIGSISTSAGSIWKKKPTDFYIIEITEPIVKADKETDKKKRRKTNTGNMIPLLPTKVCRTPTETLEDLKEGLQIFPGFDEEEYRSISFQRVYECLELLGSSPMETHAFRTESNRSHQNCLDVLLRYCGVANPSWREINHFVHFFNNQLLDCENSVVCNQLHVGDSLPGFKSFVIRFMLQMSKDFATPSASEEAEQENSGLVILRRRWENSEHPYLFFNQDRQSMSFLGFTVNTYGDLMDKENSRLFQEGIMTAELYQRLQLSGVELFGQCTNWDRSKKLEMLCKVMGVEIVYDPDSTYELTIDNMMKILAIHMRFRCGIPVILMGETGCGKTRLIRFMCNLKAGPFGPQNMILVKVHGGVTESDIKRKVNSAIELAQMNRGQRRTLDTVLFFDEANTTSAIGLIKEIMCDKRMAGKALNLESCGLKIIAACNPYRKHTDEMIKKLESAGLGYHVKSEDASEKLGNIPLRQLVYRVHKLPESMLPLVWDFGQLSIEAEVLYAAQIVHRYAREDKIPNNEEFIRIVVGTLAASQVYMREQKDECSFVSLRDVERGVQVLAWFYSKMDLFYPLIEETKKKLRASDDDDDDDDDEDEEEDDESSDESEDEGYDEINHTRLALVLALSVCYATRLEKRNSYYRRVASEFKGEYKLEGGYEEMKDETFFCQQMFLDQLQLGENIAKNTALSENVFMMVVCIELRIPLFVVGKPGSSKSLAKTIIQDNMQGELSHSDVFKHFKQILVSSYQCSPLSTAEGIITTFRQCSRFQEGKDLNRFASVVVLDEVGLAEDSPRMPLKALHPLLEDGTDGSEDLTIEGTESKARRVAFIGISNWALDPAKMNRGLMLTRGQPDRKELISSAEGICNSNTFMRSTISGLFQPLAKAYIKIYKEQRHCEILKKSKKEEFFGLRDYYSLIKMIFNKVIATQRIPSLIELEHAVKRNFGGLEDFDTWSYFHEELKHFSPENENDYDERTIDVSPVGLLKSCLHRENSKKDTRYVLLITENYAALRVLEKRFPEENAAATVIFGSSFPKDQEFTQICRDINKIKVCMETGMPVILLNMENLYESLYDALNQYYVYLGGQRYVGLGLGTHRVMCRVHENFKLIVIAEKSTVYESFPIPLINRLEKHFLVMSTRLNERQSELCSKISNWAEEFSNFKFGRKQYSLGDSFVGFNDDAPSAVLLETLHDLNENADDDELILDQSKRKLLEIATPEAVARIQGAHFGREADVIWDIYFKEQSHGSLESFLQSVLIGRKTEGGINVQVTTFSRLLSPHDQKCLEKALGESFNIKSISLNHFQTEQQFSHELRRYIKEDMAKEKILILQCDNGDENSNLIASARHLCHQSILIHGGNLILHIIFIVNLRRVAHGCKKLGSFHGVNWRCVHIDELRPSSNDIPSLIPYANHKISFIFERFGSSDTHRQDEQSEMENEVTIKHTGRTLEEKSSEAVMGIDSPVLGTGEEIMLLDDDDIQMHNSYISISSETRSAGSFPLSIEIDYEAHHVEDSHSSDIEGRPAEHPGRATEDERNLLLGILRRCIQPAIAQTATNNDLGSRLTKRIHMLLGLLSPEFQGSDFNHQFSTVLLRIIYKCLREKESQAIEDKQWFHDEAATGNNIQECGTFRRVLSYRIEKEIIPILSYIISQIDVNSNLDLLTEEEDWKRDVWLEYFSSEEVIRQLSNVQQEPMRRKKIDGSFVCWFPFSSSIRDKLTSIMQAHIRDVHSNESDRIIRDILKQSPTGNALLRLSSRQLKSYVHDLVFLEYDVNSQEHELIAASIFSRGRRKKDNAGAVYMDIVDVHMIISHPAFRQRIQCFLLILALTEDNAIELMRLIQDSDDMIVDALALQMCLERLLPQMEDILDTQDRFVWTGNVQEVKLATNQLLSLLDAYEDEFSVKAKKILTDARITWTRIQLLKMFVEHVYPPGIPCMQIDVTAALHFFDTLQSIDDEMTSASSWQKVGTTLVQLDDIAQSAYSNDRAHRQMAEKFLQIYLDESNNSRRHNEESRLELCLLLIHCYEDFKMADISKIVQQDTQLEYVCRLACDCPDLPMTISSIDTLRQIAYFRVFICKVVEVAYCDVIEKKYISEHRRKLNELYSLLESICIEAESRNLREFFLRQFIRNYGLISLKQLITNETFQWLWPEEDNESVGTAINSAQGKIVDDRRLGSNSLMKRLYEQDLADEETNLNRHAFDYVRFWRYRVPINVSHLQRSLQEFIARNGKSTCQILQKFLDKVEVLNLVKNLPDIVRLQCIISRRLSRQISSESAMKETIKKVISEHFKGKYKQEIDKLLKIYYATWRALKPTLLSHGRLSQSDDSKLTGNSPIGYLLPSTKDSGRRALLIVRCLAEAHNEIVVERRKIQGDQTKSKSVPTQDATLHHLVAFDHDMDLIPMLYAHCSYSLEIGKGTTIDYNFLALERQIVTTFIAGKPMLDVGVLMVKYADDINNLEKFEELKRRIEQREIPHADQLQMTAEFHDLAQVCDALRAVEIAIGLLSSTGAEPNYFYRKYLEDICMDPSTFLVSGKMQSVCRLTHIRSIWTMLKVERAYRFHVNREDPFDLKDIFRVEFENVDEQLLRSMDLEHLLAELTEYIILEVPRREENSIDFELQECLDIFMDNKKSTRVIKGIDALPSSLCLKHIFSFWQIVADARKKFKNV